MGKVFKRKLYDKMLNWKQTRDGSTALLIKGARRVGKSTIAEEFAKNEYKSYILIDFADAPTALWEAIDNISDRNHFFMQLQFIYGVRLYERKSVIILMRFRSVPKLVRPLNIWSKITDTTILRQGHCFLSGKTPRESLYQVRKHDLRCILWTMRSFVGL